jgi:glutamate N-acetyltransferase / amino-acid N-acetyltransferase
MKDSGLEVSINGFRFAGVSCGIKPKTAAYGGRALDLALIVSEAPCTAAGVFTQNRFPAAPVLYDKRVLLTNPAGIQAVVINSGNANACTGVQGEVDALRMAEVVENALGLAAGTALVMSTGVIGMALPMDEIEAGIGEAADQARSSTGQSREAQMLAAQAIMTTDTQPKLAMQRVGNATILGLAKGAAMIHPNMATMLAAVVTDAAVEPAVLREALRRAVDRSFNAITVDGDTSTNDTVLVLANGLAGPVDAGAFEAALTGVCQDLAQQIVRDAEGGTKFVVVRVTGAASEDDARQVAKTIATSVLVKTAVYGGDPNWGRVLAAAGRSGVELDPSICALWFAGDGGSQFQVVTGGTPLAYDEAEAARIFACHDLTIHLDLGAGAAEATVWTSDLTHEYVTLNAHYRT